MKRSIWTAILVGIFCLAGAARGDETADQRNARLAWWREARFGMFIHWGVYAVPADGEWYMHAYKVPMLQYEKYAQQFDPVKFDADQWAQAAQDAGMKYLVITAKHHDGFCMFHTAVNSYNVVDATPWHEDPLKALSQACRKHGIKFCCYYSIMDWHAQAPNKPDALHPEYDPTHFATPEAKGQYIRYMKTQLAELITQYRPAVIWFDGGWMHGWTPDDGKDLVAFLHGMDADLLVNDRALSSGDYRTPEQTIPARGLGTDWETCMTVNNNWGFAAADHNFKTPTVLLRNLIDIASKGGNYLLNVGPTAEGVIPVEEVDRLKAMGDWLKGNGEAIYGSTASPFDKQLAWGRCTQKPGKLFLEVFDWPKDGKLLVPILNKVNRAYLLSSPDQGLDVAATKDGVEVALPATAPDAIATVVVLEIDGEAQAIASERAPAIEAADDGSIHLAAAQAEILGLTAQLEGGGEQNIGFWTNVGDSLRWMVKVEKTGRYHVTLNYACDPTSADSEYTVSAGDRSVKGKVKATGSWADYTTVDVGDVDVGPEGVVTVMLSPTSKPNDAVMNLRWVELKPAANLPR